MRVAGRGNEKGRRFRVALVFLYRDCSRLVLPAVVVAAAIAATAAAAAETTLRLGARFVDRQRTAVQFASVQIIDRTLRFVGSAHFNKSKALGLTGFAIGDDADPFHRSELLKERAHRIFGGAVAQISNKNVNH